MEKTARVYGYANNRSAVRFALVCCCAQVIEAYDEYCDEFGAGTDIEIFV